MLVKLDTSTLTDEPGGHRDADAGVGPRPHPGIHRHLHREITPRARTLPAAVDRETLLELARQAENLLMGDYPAGMTRESGREFAQLFRDLGYYRKDRLQWSTLLTEANAAIADLVPALPGLATISSDGMGWFAHAMSSNRPDHTDSVLITAMIARRIKAPAPRFWATVDKATGTPLLPLASAA